MNKEDLSFGVIPVLKEKNGQYKFLLVQHRAGHWAFPKGHPKGDETPTETAQRELFEETGVADCLIQKNKVFSESYCFEKEGQKICKTVKYFLCFVSSPKIETPQDFKLEIPEVKLLTYDKALNLISYAESKDLLKKVKNLLK